MKKFRFAMSKVATVLLIIVCAYALIATVLSVVYAIMYASVNTSVTRLIISAIINALLFAIALLMLLNVYYIVDKNGVLYRAGIFSFKTRSTDIVKLVRFDRSKRLVLVKIGEKASVIVIDPKDFDEFYDALKDVAPHIYLEVADDFLKDKK